MPDVPLRIIVSFLPIDDRIRFTQLHPAWYHLQPTVQHITRPDLNKYQPYPTNAENWFSPGTWFDVKIESLGLVAAKMEWRWKDQGWGNRKGEVWLELIRDDQKISDCR